MLRSGRLSLGPTIDRFEEAFAEAVGAPYAAAVSSGTAGLHLLCITAGVGSGRRGDHVAVLVRRVGQLRDLRGCDARVRGRRPRGRSTSIPAAVEAAITERTRAVVAVDIYGYPCELDELRAICDRHGLALIQDACEALGARYKGQPSGRRAPSAVFAFYPNKQMTTGEGGMVTTHSEERVAAPAQPPQPGPRRLRRLARARPARLQLPDGRHPGRDRDRSAGEARRHPRRVAPTVAARYGGAPRRRRRPRAPVPGRRRPRAVVVRLRRRAPARRGSRGRDRVARRPRRPDGALPPVHPPAGRTCASGTATARALCPVAEEMSSRTLALPFHARLAEDDQAHVAEALRDALALRVAIGYDAASAETRARSCASPGTSSGRSYRVNREQADEHEASATGPTSRRPSGSSVGVTEHASSHSEDEPVRAPSSSSRRSSERRSTSPLDVARFFSSS